MRKIIGAAIAILIAVRATEASAQTFTAGFSQSTAFISRAVTARGGTDLSATDKAAYDGLICGLVSDGTWALFNGLYITAAPDASTALLNLESSSSPLTVTGTPSFAAYKGYTGSAGSYLNGPALNALTSQSANFSQNSAAISVYESGARNRNDDQPDTTAGGTPVWSTHYGLRSFGLLNASSASPGAYGTAIGSNLLFIVRTDANTEALYNTGFGLSPTAVDTASPSVALKSATPIISPTGTDGQAAQIAELSFGPSLTAGQVASVTSRLQVFMSSIGLNGR